MRTVAAFIDTRRQAFLRLSASRRRALAGDARRVPAHMQDSNNFWRGLSARQVLAAFHGGAS